jgi:hypothetical protein
MKRWVYEVIENDEGKISMNRDNDGFNLFELIGFSEVLHYDLMAYIRGDTKIDVIRRTATDTSPGEPPKD